MSRRIVISETRSSRARSLTSIVCWSATRSRMWWRRSTASTVPTLLGGPGADGELFASNKIAQLSLREDDRWRDPAYTAAGVDRFQFVRGRLILRGGHMAGKVGTEDQLFVRKSTGLVREASALDATIFNAVFSAPVGATLAWGVFFALSAFPGSDLVTATILSFVLNIPVLLMMGLLASSMPRTGGDYVWVSRILTPPLATISNFGAALSAMIGATFWARYFPVFALGPVLVTLGVIFGNDTLTNWGTSFQKDNLWI